MHKRRLNKWVRHVKISYPSDYRILLESEQYKNVSKDSLTDYLVTNFYNELFNSRKVVKLRAPTKRYSPHFWMELRKKLEVMEGSWTMGELMKETGCEEVDIMGSLKSKKPPKLRLDFDEYQRGWYKYKGSTAKDFVPITQIARLDRIVKSKDSTRKNILDHLFRRECLAIGKPGRTVPIKARKKYVPEEYTRMGNAIVNLRGVKGIFEIEKRIGGDTDETFSCIGFHLRNGVCKGYKNWVFYPGLSIRLDTYDKKILIARLVRKWHF